jgi:hypothetical protein
MPVYTFATNNFNCRCGYSFNQKSGDSMKKYNIVKRLHRKKCDQYVEKPVITDYSDAGSGKEALKKMLRDKQECLSGQ